MSELYNASDISKMSNMILKTADAMQESLEEISKNLNTYRSCLNDSISKEADELVKSIQNRIDTIRVDFAYRSENANTAAKIIDVMESGGLGVI